MGIKVLDCTLRDGAYVVDSKFGEQRILNILNTLENANIDIIECGWLRDCCHEKNSVLYKIPNDAKSYIKNIRPEIAMMFDYGKYDISKLPQNNGLTNIIRIAFYKKNLDEISFAVEKVKNKGYKVYFTNAEFEYQNAKRRVEINEYMIAFKEWNERIENESIYIFCIRHDFRN